MDEMIKRISDLLIKFNSTFKLEASIDENEEVVTGLNINSIENDGSEFIQQIFDFFGPIIESSGEYQLVYDKNKGIIIAKTIKKTIVTLEDAF